MPSSASFSYGPRVSTQAAVRYLERLFMQPAEQIPPICLWGKHGIGKTELIWNLAQHKQWECRTISPAQFEEMGDLIGLPYLEKDAAEKNITHFAPPEWVPREAGPGILLIDDFNRADDRIIRGLMALWQERRLSSWSMPKGWFIVLTGNPEGENYSVTPVDEASLSRLLHLNLYFDATSWAIWARGQQLPAEAIDFVLQHPELIDGQQTTARTLTFFFRLWQQLGKPMPDDPHLGLLAESAIAQVAAAAFVRFLQEETIPLPAAAEFLQGSEEQMKSLLQQLLAETPPRLDRIGLLCSRLQVYLQSNSISSLETKGLISFLLLDILPAEQRLLLMHNLSQAAHPVLVELLKHPKLSQLLLS